MGTRETARRRAAQAREARASIGRDLFRMRQDSGLTQAAVARAAGVSPGHLCGIERGTAEASTDVLTAIADVLGADLVVRAYPTTGPRIRDHLQAAIGEALLRMARPRWRPYIEVPVRRPARGFIDIVLVEDAPPLCICTEIHSALPRLEQALRWAHDKAGSLASADLWRAMPPETEISRLLVLRSTSALRDLARRYSETLATAYPARSVDVYDALTGRRAWPGPGVLWARVEGGRAEILRTPPRGVGLGR